MVQTYVQSEKFFLQVVNDCSQPVQFQRGIPVTDRPGHGVGVRSICAIVERYGGIVQFFCAEWPFHTAAFPVIRGQTTFQDIFRTFHAEASFLFAQGLYCGYSARHRKKRNILEESIMKRLLTLTLALVMSLSLTGLAAALMTTPAAAM